MSDQPIDIRPDHEALVRNILLARLPEGVRVWAFGSRAKWLAKPYSDLDLALEAADCLPDALIADLKDDFRESDLPWKVDVLDLNAIDPSFRKLIDKDRVGFSLREDWQNIQLGDLCKVITKGTTPSAKLGGFADGGVNYIKSESLNYDGHIDVSKFAYVSGKTHQKLKRSILQENDVLISIAGANLGKVGMVTDEIVPANTNQAVGIVRVNVLKADPQFIQFYLRNPQFVANNPAGVAQSAQPNLNLGDISRFQIPEFPLPEQRAIASVLGALDDKIYLNRRMNETLEAMARAIFRDWFVDFGPTRAKMAGREPYLAEEIWELFPDRVGEDGLPEGWEMGTLADIAETNAKSWTAKNHPDEVEYVDLSSTKWGVIEATAKLLWEKTPSRARRIARICDTIVATTRPGNGSFAYISRAGLTASTGFAVLTPKEQVYRDFIYIAATNPENIKRLANFADGHGGAYPAVKPSAVSDTEIVLPRIEAVEAFAATISAMRDRIEFNKLETRTLAQTRDLLLPKLMSEEVRVKDVEKEMGTAL